MQAQYIPLLAQVEQPLVDCFQHGGGVPYSEFPRFQRLMAEDSGAVHDAALIGTILPLVPGLTERLEAGIDVADVGCGSGHAVNLMAQAFPASRFVGYDFSEETIAAARRESEEWELTNTEFVVRDVAELDVEEEYDLVTAFDAIHDQAFPAQVLANIAASLKAGGTFLMVDVKASSHVHENLGLPASTFLYTVSLMHCMTVSLAQGGVGLGTAWGTQTATRMLSEAGFEQVDVKEVETDFFNAYYVATKP
jgi:SAM-dependent methyltransferase